MFNVSEILWKKILECSHRLSPSGRLICWFKAEIPFFISVKFSKILLILTSKSSYWKRIPVQTYPVKFDENFQKTGYFIKDEIRQFRDGHFTNHGCNVFDLVLNKILPNNGHELCTSKK